MTLLQEVQAETVRARQAALERTWYPWVVKRILRAARAGEGHVSLLVNPDGIRRELADRLKGLGFHTVVGYAKGACVFQRGEGFNTLFVAWEDTARWLEIVNSA